MICTFLMPMFSFAFCGITLKFLILLDFSGNLTMFWSYQLIHVLFD